MQIVRRPLQPALATGHPGPVKLSTLVNVVGARCSPNGPLAALSTHDAGTGPPPRPTITR
jgi:hypothetical protein